MLRQIFDDHSPTKERREKQNEVWSHTGHADNRQTKSVTVCSSRAVAAHIWHTNQGRSSFWLIFNSWGKSSQFHSAARCYIKRTKNNDHKTLIDGFPGNQKCIRKPRDYVYTRPIKKNQQHELGSLQDSKTKEGIFDSSRTERGLQIRGKSKNFDFKIAHQ